MSISGINPSREHNDSSGKLRNKVADIATVIRQNHALEHATIAVLLERLEVRVKMAGYTGLTGFHIMGNIPTKTLEEAAYEGLKRLKEGEKDIAISPMCGTNLAVAGLAAGIAAVVAGRRHTGISKFARVLTASAAAAIIAQPLGPLAQKHITTSSNLRNVQIVGVRKSGHGRFTRHKVILARI